VKKRIVGVDFVAQRNGYQLHVFAMSLANDILGLVSATVGENKYLSVRGKWP
jgi:hypothetical protein